MAKIKILIIGKINKINILYKNYNLNGLNKAFGFTLIELIVVITIMSIILFISMPKIQNFILPNNSKKVSRWLIGEIRALKERAIKDQKTYALNINFDKQAFWVSWADISEEELLNAQKQSFILPEGFKIDSVREFSSNNIFKITTGETFINFYKNGYSDKAIISIQNIQNINNNLIEFVIEPFLPRVKQKNN